VGPWHAVGWSGQDPKPDAPTTDADAAEAGQLTRATQAVSRGGGQAAEVHHSGGRRASNRRRSKVQNPRPASGGQLSRPSNRRPATGGQQPEASNRRPATGGQQSEAGSRRSALEGQRLEARSRRPAAGASCLPRRAGTGQLPPSAKRAPGGVGRHRVPDTRNRIHRPGHPTATIGATDWPTREIDGRSTQRSRAGLRAPVRRHRTVRTATRTAPAAKNKRAGEAHLASGTHLALQSQCGERRHACGRMTRHRSRLFERRGRAPQRTIRERATIDQVGRPHVVRPWRPNAFRGTPRPSGRGTPRASGRGKTPRENAPVIVVRKWRRGPS